MKKLLMSIVCCALSANTFAKDHTDVRLNQYNMEDLVNAMELLQAKQNMYNTAYFVQASRLPIQDGQNGYQIGGSFQVGYGHSAFSVGLGFGQCTISALVPVKAETPATEAAEAAPAPADEAQAEPAATTDETVEKQLADVSMRLAYLPVLEGIMYGSPFADSSVFIGGNIAPVFVHAGDAGYGFYYKVSPCLGYEFGRTTAVRFNVKLSMDLLEPIFTPAVGKFHTSPYISASVGF